MNRQRQQMGENSTPVRHVNASFILRIYFFLQRSSYQSRGSQAFSDHVPPQHFDRWACTPKISYDKKAE